VADARRDTHSVIVANASVFKVGDWVQLSRTDASTAAVDEAVSPYPVDSSWTSIITTGVTVDEHHLVVSISGNEISFKEPIHSEVTSAGNWSVVLFDPLEEVGVEDIAFRGNWISNFVHHASFYDDGGWSALQFANTVNAWIRNCRFTDWSRAMKVGNSAAVTVSNIRLDGNPGHNTLTFNNSSHCFAGMIDDAANHWHACGVAGKCSGNVFWKSEYSADTCFESHASQPRHTLLDNISGGWHYGRMGGASGNKPNHLENLVVWNYFNANTDNLKNSNGSYDSDNKFEFWRSGGVQVVMPYVVGFHGWPMGFEESQVAVLESNGAAVEPASLYEAQYKLRTGKPFTRLLYDEWSIGHGLSGGDSAYDADPDGDFRKNLAEYALGGIPGAGDNSPSEIVGFGVGSEGMEYVYSRRHNAAALGLSYLVEFTDNLMAGKWSESAVEEVGFNALDEDFESVTNLVSIGATSNGFMRLKVTISK
jgi:hypothetical protein